MKKELEINDIKLIIKKIIKLFLNVFIIMYLLYSISLFTDYSKSLCKIYLGNYETYEKKSYSTFTKTIESYRCKDHVFTNENLKYYLKLEKFVEFFWGFDLEIDKS